jgi:hypothetical protein
MTADDIRIHTGFRVTLGEILAGGPVEMEFFVENSGKNPLQLQVSGDRMRQRPGQFKFAAAFEGSLLPDPMATFPYMGGPTTVVQVTNYNPWLQPLVLNQFVKLEQTIERLPDGATGRINLECRRPLPLLAMVADALLDKGSSVLIVNLTFDLRRDDKALERLLVNLLNEVMHGPQVLRERRLALLLSMRKTAHTQINELARHSDASVAIRARQVLSTFT